MQSSKDPHTQKPRRISRRHAIAATGAGLLAAGTAFAQRSKPNIVFIMADDLGFADLSCYGRTDYQTPNIDRLATQGIKFMQAYANSSVCSATRTALITGRYQYRLRIGLEEPLGGPARGIGIPADHPTLPSLLRDAGYGTTLIGKWHLGYLPDYDPLKNGYDHFWGFRGPYLDYFTHKSGTANTDTLDLWDDSTKVDQAGYLTDMLGDRTAKVIADYKQQNQPFFISVHFNAPHWPWEGPADEAESRRISSLMDFDGGTLKTYGEMVKSLDTAVGKILASLEKEGIADNTIVVFTSDNGGERFSNTWPFSGRKEELLEGGLRIPLIVRWPGHTKPGTTTEQTAMSMDWLPTFTAAAGTAPDSRYPTDGMDLTRALEGAAPVPRRLYWRYRYNAQRAVRDGDMKYLEINGTTFLFNVVDDPLERANLQRRQPEEFARLQQSYQEWNATMLPEDPSANSSGLLAIQNPDRPGNQPEAKGKGKGKQKGKQ